MYGPILYMSSFIRGYEVKEHLPKLYLIKEGYFTF